MSSRRKTSKRVLQVTHAITGEFYVGMRVVFSGPVGVWYGHEPGSKATVMKIEEQRWPDYSLVVAFDDGIGNSSGTVVDGKPCWFVAPAHFKPIWDEEIK